MSVRSLLGSGLAFTNFYPEHSKIIQIVIDGGNIDRRHWVHIGVVGDIKESLKQLDSLVEEKQDDSFANKYPFLLFLSSFLPSIPSLLPFLLFLPYPLSMASAFVKLCSSPF